MYDALTTAAISDELNSLLVDARIQGAAQIDALSIVLEVYARHRRWWLTLSADPQLARVVLSAERVAGDAERVTPLLLLLRKYARGGRIVSVSQPRYERILRVSIAKPLEGNKHGDGEGVGHAAQDLVYTELVAELMGRRSNLIYLDADGRILEAVKRVTSSMSRVRTVRPNQPYTPPPPQAKLEPRLASPERLLAAARDVAESQTRTQPVEIDKWLVASIAALSPALAREVVCARVLRFAHRRPIDVGAGDTAGRGDQELVRAARHRRVGPDGVRACKRPRSRESDCAAHTR